MCDCPTAGVFTTHETHRSWIIFKETKTENGTTNTVHESSIEHTNDESTTKPDMFLLLNSLDPHLRPVTPDKTNQQSMQLFEEHKKLAREYWEVQEELVFVTRRKTQLEGVSHAAEQRRKRLQELQNERESLLLAREFMKNEQKSASTGTSRASVESGWVVIPKTGERMN